MRRSAAALPVLCLLAACTRDAPGRPVASPVDRAVRTVPAELVSAPAGVTAAHGGPRCTLVEHTGGPRGPRWSVSLATKGREGDYLATPAKERRRGFFLLEVEAGGRRFTGYVTTESTRQATGPSYSLTYSPPVPLALRFDALPMQPDNYAGVQEVPADLTACRLTIALPDPGQTALGGMLLGESDGTGVVVDSEGAVHPLSER